LVFAGPDLWDRDPLNRLMSTHGALFLC